MANRLTVQESINPYAKASIPGASTAADVSRAVVNNDDSELVACTFEDGTVVNIWLIQGVVYPLALIKTDDAGVVFLY
jgi:hypothetical protein